MFFTTKKKHYEKIISNYEQIISEQLDDIIELQRKNKLLICLLGESKLELKTQKAMNKNLRIKVARTQEKINSLCRLYDID